MITRLSKISDIAVFNAYEWPESLLDFAPRNVIYGWNYSGKTTISRLIRSLSIGNTSMLPDGGRFEIHRDGVTINSVNIRLPDVNVRVFNADAVEASLLWNGGADPILVIGEDSVRLQHAQSALKDRLRKSSLVRERWEAFRGALQTEVDRNMSDIAARVKNELSLPVFNRSPHLASALQSAIDRKETPPEADVSKWWGILRSEEKRSLKVTEPSSDWLNGLKMAQEHLKRIAMRVPIELLIRDQALAYWVSEGVELHRKRDKCAFCDSEISEDRWKILRDHHSESVIKQNNDIRRSLGSMPVVMEMNIPSDSETYPDLKHELAELSVRVLKIKGRIDLRLSELRSGLEEKLNRPDDVVKRTRRPILKLFRILNDNVEKIKKIIKDHNDRVAAGAGARVEARTMLTEHMSISLFMDRMLSEQQKRVNTWSSLISRRVKYEKILREKIYELEKEIGDKSIGAERVNSFLGMYFGSERLKVAANRGRFQLMRSGIPAQHLSEGEKTAIAFSYFVAKLEEVGSNLSEMIVYVDDPISSLDSNHIFNTFSLIKSRMKACKQLFVSTHNFEFFRLLKSDSFFGERRRERRVTGYYYIDRVGDVSSIGNLPEYIRKYSSEYHMLFDKVIGYQNEPGSVDFILIPNILRRLLETYTKFRFPSSSITLDQRLSRIFDEEMAGRVYKLINHLSHSDNVSALYELPSESEVSFVLDAVIARLQEFDPEHVEGMREACGS